MPTSTPIPATSGGVTQNITYGALGAQSGMRGTLFDNVYQPAVSEGSDKSAPSRISDSEKIARNVMGFIRSDAVSWGVTGVTAISALSGGATTFAPFAAGLAAGYVGGKIGSALGEAAGHAIASALGLHAVSTDGNQPARKDDPIAHANKDLGLWGIIGGVIAGAVVAVVVSAAIIGSGGTALPVLIGAAAAAGGAGGLVGGLIGGFMGALSQYGEVKGYILEGSPDVTFEGRPVARVGDKVKCEDHPGEPAAKLAEGVKTVAANGKLIVRRGHRTECDANVDDGCSTIITSTDTEVVYDIKPSTNIWLEGAATVAPYLPWGKWAQKMGIGAIPAQNKTSTTEEPNTNTKKDSGSPVKDTDGPTTHTKKDGNSPSNCGFQGEPVDMATGDFTQQWGVVSLFNSTLSLNLMRLYRSKSTLKGMFGEKWSDVWSQFLIVDRGQEKTTYVNEDGVSYVYHTPESDVYAVNLHNPHCVLFGVEQHQLYLFNRQSQTALIFERLPNQPEEKRYLTWITDYLGNSMHLDYDENGLVKVTHSDGYYLRVQSKDWLIHEIEYFDGQVNQQLLRCKYNDLGQLIYCHSHQFGETFHDYDDNGYMVSWRDTQMTQTDVVYDEQGRVISTQASGGYYTDRFSYDIVNHCTTYYDAEGGISRYWYNDNGLVIKEEDALGRIKKTEWDLSLKMSETDALGRTLSYRYNGYGELTEVILPNGEKQQYRYNERGLLTERILTHGERWSYEYDERGALSKLISPYGLTWNYQYDDRGRLIRLDYPDETYESYEYSEITHQLIGRRNSHGELTGFVRDLFGRVTQLTLLDNSQYYYEYSQSHANPDGSLTKITTPEGVIQTFAYNSERLLTESVDGNGNKTQYTYGAFDLLQSQTLPNGETLTFHYDKLTRLTEVKNTQGDSYCYEYDKAGQLVREMDFTGRSRAYAYDAVGRLIRKTQADGHIETYAYDIEDKLLTRNTWQPVLQGNDICRYELAHQVCYTYTNKTGQLSQTINTQYLPYFAQHITEFEYDEQYRLIAEIQDGERIEVELDKYGRQTALLLPNGVESAVKISQGFNQYGELTQFQVNNHNPLNLSYDKLGRQTRKQNQNGFILAEHFSPSGLLQAQGGGWNNSLTEQQLSDYQPNQTYPIAGTQISRKWQYDKAFNLVHTQDNHWGATEYRVNKNGQVTDVLNGLRHSEHYRYDSQLNLTQKAQRETDALGQYQFEAANDASFGMKQRNGRITRFGNKTYKYDELGRLHSKTETKKGFRPVTTYYKWNSQSQLVELHSPFKGSWRYEYDSFGRRITKYQIQTDQPQPNQVINMPIRANQDYWHKINELWAKEAQSQSKKTSQKLTALSGYRYLYKQNQLVAEAPLQITSTEGNLALTQANWADAIYWLYQEDDFTPTARYEKGQLHYTVADQVGTITELLTEDGYIDYRQKLNLWGEVEIDGHRHYAANDSSPLKCNHRFVGQYYDDESELHYNRFRYYSPETGQYISHDPIGLLGGFNPYGYVGIPTAFVDPLGLATCPSNNPTANNQQSSNTQTINPEEIRFSQSSVNDDKGVFASMAKDGWKGEPIDVVRMPDGKLTTIDNTRVAAARSTKTPVQANIRGFDEPLPADQIPRFTTPKGTPVTWGDAITLRIGKQNAGFRNNNPMGSSDMPKIKIKGGNE